VKERYQEIDDKNESLRELFAEHPKAREFLDRFEMSWVYHDNALEGVVYAPQELQAVQERQRPAMRASGGWPIVLTTGSHPSSSSGVAAGARGALISIGPLTRLRLLPGTDGKRSPLSVRLIPAGLCSTEVAAVVADTSSPIRKAAKPNAAPQPAKR